MSNYKATFEQWQSTKKWAANGSITDICLLELRSRIEQLEAQASHIGDINKMVSVATVTRDRDETGNYVIVHDTATPPTVATDEELGEAWDTAGAGGTYSDRFRALYNLGVAHGQASSREVADPAPGAGGLVERISHEIRIGKTTLRCDEATAVAAILEVAEWLREQGTPASGWAMRLEQEAER